MSDRIEKPMSETSLHESHEKEKRRREESPSIEEVTETTKRRELDAPESGSSTCVRHDGSNSAVDRSAEESKEKLPADETETSAPESKAGQSQSSSTLVIPEEASPAAMKDASPIKSGGFKGGFGQAKGFGALSSSASAFENTSGSNTFSSLFSKSSSESAFSSLLTKAPTSSIFSQETSGDVDEKDKTKDDKDGSEHEFDAPTQPDDDQYVVVKGLEKTSVPTGEEGESCIHLVRAKLYAIDPKNKEAGWKERGVGNLRILRDHTQRTRLVMRQDAVLRVVLNLPLHPSYKLEDGGESMGDKTLRLFGIEEGSGIWLAIRVSNKKVAQELKAIIQESMDCTPTVSTNGKSGVGQAKQADHAVSGIVPHNKETESTVDAPAAPDSVEATEIKHEQEILHEKAKFESVEPIQSANSA